MIEINVKIQEAFARYFKPFGIELPAVLDQKGYINDKGWAITYAINEDERGYVCLDVFADHRMTNPRWIRILIDGQIINGEGLFTP